MSCVRGQGPVLRGHGSEVMGKGSSVSDKGSEVKGHGSRVTVYLIKRLSFLLPSVLPCSTAKNTSLIIENQWPCL